MFIVCTGALQSIPGDVREAAKIDGANAFRTLRSIIMPLLLVAVGPLLIASFAFNFNNFTLIYLLTGGGPFDAGNTSIGSSDLLITYAYRLAFSGTTPELRVRRRGLDLHLRHRRGAELPRIPPDQVPGRGQLMSEVYQRESVALPTGEVEAGSAARPSRRARRAPGQWRLVAARAWPSSPWSGRCSRSSSSCRRRLNPAGTLNQRAAARPGVSLANFETLFNDAVAALRVLVQELAAHRRRRRAVLGLHRRVRGLRLLPAAVHRPPRRACSPCCCCRCSRRCSRSSRSTSPSSRIGDVLPAFGPQQPLGPDPRLPRRRDGRQRVAAQGLLRHGAARARRGGQGRRRQPRPHLLHDDAAPRHADPRDGLHARLRRPVQRVHARQHLPHATSTPRRSASASTA